MDVDVVVFVAAVFGNVLFGSLSRFSRAGNLVYIVRIWFIV